MLQPLNLPHNFRTQRLPNRSSSRLVVPRGVTFAERDVCAAAPMRPTQEVKTKEEGVRVTPGGRVPFADFQRQAIETAVRAMG